MRHCGNLRIPRNSSAHATDLEIEDCLRDLYSWANVRDNRNAFWRKEPRAPGIWFEFSDPGFPARFVVDHGDVLPNATRPCGLPAFGPAVAGIIFCLISLGNAALRRQ